MKIKITYIKKNHKGGGEMKEEEEETNAIWTKIELDGIIL